jgi:hypothetical protein
VARSRRDARGAPPEDLLEGEQAVPRRGVVDSFARVELRRKSDVVLARRRHRVHPHRRVVHRDEQQLEATTHLAERQHARRMREPPAMHRRRDAARQPDRAIPQIAMQPHDAG